MIVQNEMRGSRATAEALVAVGTRELDWDLAYCGSRIKGKENQYGDHLVYKWEFDEPEDWYSELRRSLPSAWSHYFLEPDNEAGLAQSPEEIQLWVSGFIQATYRRRAIQKFFEDELHKKYSWIVFVRSDFCFLNPVPAPNKMGKNHIIVVDGDHYGGINDRFVAVPIGLLRDFAKLTDFHLWADQSFLTELAFSWRHNPHKNPESLYKFLAQKAGLFPKFRAVPQLGFCVRGFEEGTRWAKGVWSAKRSLYVKYPTELILAKWARYRSLILAQRNPRLRSLLTPQPLHVSIVMKAKWAPRLLLVPLLCAAGEWGLAGKMYLRNRQVRAHE